jgi:hypothetical protein
MWVEPFSKGFAHGYRGEKILSPGFVFLGYPEIQKISLKILSYLSMVFGKGSF